MTIVPITFWTRMSDIKRLSRQPLAMHSKMHIGLPFKMNDPDNAPNPARDKARTQNLSENYVVLPLNRFFDPHVKSEAARIGGHISRTVLGNSNRNKGWMAMINSAEIRDIPFRREGGPRNKKLINDAWTYWIIEIVLRERPAEYLTGKQHLGDFFAERFQIDYGGDPDNDVPFISQQMFHHHLLDRAYLDASLDLKVELAFENEQIIGKLEGLQIIGETYTEMMIALTGLLSGVTGAVVVDMILEGFIGYLQFVHELDNAEKDGIITDDEAFGASIALVGVFLPFSKILPGFIDYLVSVGLSVVGVASVISQIALGMLRLVLGLIEALSADAAGFEGYAQYDPANTLFIQFDSSTDFA